MIVRSLFKLPFGNSLSRQARLQSPLVLKVSLCPFLGDLYSGGASVNASQVFVNPRSVAVLTLFVLWSVRWPRAQISTETAYISEEGREEMGPSKVLASQIRCQAAKWRQGEGTVHVLSPLPFGWRLKEAYWVGKESSKQLVLMIIPPKPVMLLLGQGVLKSNCVYFKQQGLRPVAG